MDHDTCGLPAFCREAVVETVEDPLEQISLDEASQLDGHYDLGDIVRVPSNPNHLDALQLECKEPDPSRKSARGRAESGI